MNFYSASVVLLWTTAMGLATSSTTGNPQSVRTVVTRARPRSWVNVVVVWLGQRLKAIVVYR
jgi:hypothetical protein